jgi:hypothetical protein
MIWRREAEANCKVDELNGEKPVQIQLLVTLFIYPSCETDNNDQR